MSEDIMAYGFLGDSVSVGVYDPVYHPNFPQDGLQVFGTETVFGGIEFPNVAALPQFGRIGATPAIIDVTHNEIQISIGSEGGRVEPGIFDGYVFTFAGKRNDAIKSVKIVDTNVEGLGPRSVQFNRHSILVNGSGSFPPDFEPAFIDLEAKFTHPGPGVVHERAKNLIMGHD